MENGGNHPKGSTAIFYMSRKLSNEYKNTKIKAAVKLYCNADPTMAAARSFEELPYRMDATPSLKMLRSTQGSWIYSCG